VKGALSGFRGGISARLTSWKRAGTGGAGRTPANGQRIVGGSTVPPAASDAGTLGAVLSLKQQQQIGRALAAHAYAFQWEEGDVLLLDNTVTLHDGLPGFGPRRLCVILLDEAVLPQSLDTLVGGIFEDPAHGPVGSR